MSSKGGVVKETDGMSLVALPCKPLLLLSAIDGRGLQLKF